MLLSLLIQVKLSKCMWCQSIWNLQFKAKSTWSEPGEQTERRPQSLWELQFTVMQINKLEYQELHSDPYVPSVPLLCDENKRIMYAELTRKECWMDPSNLAKGISKCWHSSLNRAVCKTALMCTGSSETIS